MRPTEFTTPSIPHSTVRHVFSCPLPLFIGDIARQFFHQTGPPKSSGGEFSGGGIFDVRQCPPPRCGDFRRLRVRAPCPVAPKGKKGRRGGASRPRFRVHDDVRTQKG